jgi:anti-anti-sigma regulatory factor
MEINTREKTDIIIFDIEGEIRRSDITDVTLHQLVKDQLDSGKRNILLNFQNVDFINLGGKLKIAKISKKLYLVFQVTMLTKVLEIFDEEEVALDSFLKNQ